MAISFMLLRSPFGWVGVAIFAMVWFASQYSASQRPPGSNPDEWESDEPAAFVGYVLDDVQDTWERDFLARSERYERATLVLFNGTTTSSCGFGEVATGPFYCPADRQVYIDLSYYEQLRSRFGTPGDFAQAYVIGHELGHHVQNLRGTSERVARAPRSAQLGPEGLSLRLELQADCYAGVWANDAAKRRLIEIGEIDEALRSAAAISDERIQTMNEASVSPETFSHGTSDQRVRWFGRGFQSGDFNRCDAFTTDI